MAFEVHAGTSWAAGQLPSSTLFGVNSQSTISQLALRNQAAGEMHAVRQVDQVDAGLLAHVSSCHSTSMCFFLKYGAMLQETCRAC